MQVKCWVVWFCGEGTVEPGMCGPDQGEIIVFQKEQWAREWMDRIRRRARAREFGGKYEIRPAVLEVGEGERE